MKVTFDQIREKFKEAHSTKKKRKGTADSKFYGSVSKACSFFIQLIQNQPRIFERSDYPERCNSQNKGDTF
jgi:hypothetical protein